MKNLKEEDVIRIMREEWGKRVQSLVEKIDLKRIIKVDGKNISPISDELKVRHEKSQIRYDIVSVSMQDAVLRTPEGEEFMISAEELENDYVLD